MKFRSNNGVAIHLKDLKKAEAFYGGVLGFRLRSKTRRQLMFETGHFHLYLNQARKVQPPVLSFSVKDLGAARDFLRQHGCKIVADWGGAFYFQDPFGVTFDVIEG
jgi:catechol 2,3-dioxygenase-like lactoylglutathione lyase family enzyme